jgi:hypothetical protein
LASGKIARALPSWEFVPRSLAILDDLVIAGSEQGWIQAQSLNKSKMEEMATMKTQLSKEINNSICLYVALDGTRRALIGYLRTKLDLFKADLKEQRSFRQDMEYRSMEERRHNKAPRSNKSLFRLPRQDKYGLRRRLVRNLPL